MNKLATKKKGAALTKALKKKSGEGLPVFVALGSDCFTYYCDLIRCVNLDITCEVFSAPKVSSIKNLDVKDRDVVLVLSKSSAKTSKKQFEKWCKAGGAASVRAIIC